MKYDFDHIVDRRGSGCVKYDDRSAFGNADIIPLWIADMDFEAPDFICDAIARRAAHRVFGYGMRSESYYRAIMSWVKRRNGWDIDGNWLDFTPGVVAGFVFALRALSAPGDGIVIMPPVYPPFAAQIKANDRRVVENPLVPEAGNYRIDFDDLDRKLEQATVLLLCNPHNPTGRVFTTQELTRIAALCRKHGVHIVSDEIHSDLIFHGKKHIPTASLSPEIAANVVTGISGTKTFNLAGLQASAVVFPNRHKKETFDRFWMNMDIHRNNAFSVTAMETAFREGEEWLDQLLPYLSENFDFVVNYCERHIPKIKTYAPDATYLMWLDCRALGLSNQELHDFMIQNARLGLNDGCAFGRSLNGFMRLNAACPRSVLERALHQLEAAVNSL